MIPPWQKGICYHPHLTLESHISDPLLWGILLLLVYSVGHSFLVLIAGTSVGFVHKISASSSYGALSKILRILMGTMILLIALYMFYLGF